MRVILVLESESDYIGTNIDHDKDVLFKLMCACKGGVRKIKMERVGV